MPATIEKRDLLAAPPAEVRARIREGAYEGDSWGMAVGYAQTAMVALPADAARDFLVFAHRNPRPCPLLEVVEPGETELQKLAPGADLRTDLARYRVFEAGTCVAEPTDARGAWREDLMAFAVGCTGSFEQLILAAGIRLRHLEEDFSVPIYITDRDCERAGRLHGRLAVSMRPIRQEQVSAVVSLTARFPAFHGAPLGVGDPEAFGIDLDRPDWGDRIPLRSDEVPVFWACSVTPQLVAIASQVELMITNFPSHMFITDLRTEQMAVIP
jgi:uncharacterized protein YcsI (UPF0317 family)